MHSAALFTLLAVGASVAAAAETVVQTSKITRTMTVTSCAASYTDCPLSKASAAAATSATSSSSAADTVVAPSVPASTFLPNTANTTVSVGPTRVFPTGVIPTGVIPTGVFSTGVFPGSSTSGPVTIPTGAASGFQAQKGAAAAVVVALIAMVQ
ncbi:hypothetical protein EsDP_00002704 [Epichloe bromicola]|uniref:GPI anchored serine-rich protein n=1 Tax=Epichloe bromicola TaxID=79588 RepID=A0ABQ0CLJ7_9HYPO